MKDFSFITNSHPEYIENLYRDFINDPSSVDPEMKKFFEGFDFAFSNASSKPLVNGSSNGTTVIADKKAVSADSRSRPLDRASCSRPSAWLPRRRRSRPPPRRCPSCAETARRCSKASKPFRAACTRRPSSADTAGPDRSHRSCPAPDPPSHSDARAA